jgi:hypothetical protein
MSIGGGVKGVERNLSSWCEREHVCLRRMKTTSPVEQEKMPSCGTRNMCSLAE